MSEQHRQLTRAAAAKTAQQQHTKGKQTRQTKNTGQTELCIFLCVVQYLLRWAQNSDAEHTRIAKDTNRVRTESRRASQQILIQILQLPLSQ